MNRIVAALGFLVLGMALLAVSMLALGDFTLAAYFTRVSGAVSLGVAMAIWENWFPRS